MSGVAPGDVVEVGLVDEFVTIPAKMSMGEKYQRGISNKRPSETLRKGQLAYPRPPNVWAVALKRVVCVAYFFSKKNTVTMELPWYGKTFTRDGINLSSDKMAGLKSHALPLRMLKLCPFHSLYGWD